MRMEPDTQEVEYEQRWTRIDSTHKRQQQGFVLVLDEKGDPVRNGDVVLMQRQTNPPKPISAPAATPVATGEKKAAAKAKEGID